MTLPTQTLLPNELERRQIFHALKRWSSFTAWNRILGFYQAWADVVEDSLRVASAKGLEGQSSLKESHWASILKGVAHCDDGVKRLRQGDKRVFRSNFHGDFVKARQGALDHWGWKDIYMQTGDVGLDAGTTPLLDEFMTALRELEFSWDECAPDILEPEADRSQVTRTFFNEHFKAKLKRIVFPHPLPEVPDPLETVLVRTGKPVTCSGIWEPVKTPERKVVSLFTATPPLGPFPAVGTMSYLHGGAVAPAMASHGKVNGEACTWRLLWPDDRYVDGSIPAEEGSFVFTGADTPEPAAPMSGGTPITVRESGQRAPVAGRWLLQDALDVAIELAAGEVLPLHQGRHARWVLAIL